MCYNQTGDISNLDGTPLKLVDKFTYLGSSVDTRLTKAWTAINRLSIIWKSAATSILLYGCTTWTLTKRLEKKLDGNYTRMLWASNLEQVLAATPHKKPDCTATCLLSRKLFKLDQPDMQDTAGESGTNSFEMYSYGPPHRAVQKQEDQHEYTFSSYVRIRDVVLKTCLGKWTIGRSGERGSGISVLPAQHDDDDTFPQYIRLLLLNF